jgi:hypothetical protein
VVSPYTAAADPVRVRPDNDPFLGIDLLISTEVACELCKRIQAQGSISLQGCFKDNDVNNS